MSIDNTILKTNKGEVFVSVNVTDKLNATQVHRLKYIISLFENRLPTTRHFSVFEFLDSILGDSDELGSFIVFHIRDIKEALS